MKILAFVKMFGLIIIGTISIGTTIYAINSQSEGHKTTTVFQNISYYDPCTTVRHTGSNSYFVPTKTEAEWISFKNNNPPDITINGGSATLTPGVQSDGYTANYGYYTGNGGIGSLDCDTLLDGKVITTFNTASSVSYVYLATSPTIQNIPSEFNSITLTDANRTVKLLRTNANYIANCGNGSECIGWNNSNGITAKNMLIANANFGGGSPKPISFVVE